MSDKTAEHSQQIIFLVTIIVLAPLSLFESMKQVSYISIIAMTSITVALIYLVIYSIIEILNPSYDKMYVYSNFVNFPYFFGISLFLFEGNALSLEIEHQMIDGEKKFMNALGPALLATCTMVITVSALAFGAYAQYTQDTVLVNLEPGAMTYTV